MNKKNNSSHKFLFDLNKFDSDAPKEEAIVEEEVFVDPPAPTFTEDDLEAAKAIAHNQGKAEGQRQEHAKREQYLADNLKKIGESFEALFAAELYREKQYEEESIRLSLKILEQLAPTLSTYFGQETLKQKIKETLETQADQSEIRIEVHPDYASDIDQFIEDIWSNNDNAPRCKVVANSDIELGGCVLSWKDGGMVRRPSELAEKIKTVLKSFLENDVSSPAPHSKPQKNDGGKTNIPRKDGTNVQNNAIKESDKNNVSISDTDPIQKGEQE